MKLPAHFHNPLQPLAVLILLFGACSTVPEQNLDAWLPEGFYHFECEIVNQNDLARVTHKNGKVDVELLGDFKGGFTFSALQGGLLDIQSSRMNYPGLKRSFKGEGRVIQPGVARGTAISWLKSFGPVGRDHREGPWSLRPATQQEVDRYQKKKNLLEEYRNRVRDS